MTRMTWRRWFHRHVRYFDTSGNVKPVFRVTSQPTVAELLTAAEHYQRARDWDGDTAAGEAALHEAGHALQDLCARVAKEGIQ